MAQWVKDPAWSLPWHLFNPWSWNFHLLWMWQKKKKKKREREIYFDSRTFLKIIIIDKYISIGMEKK